MADQQLAALLDQLKRPIEEAPRGGMWLIALEPNPPSTYVASWRTNTGWLATSFKGEGYWIDILGNTCNPTHYLPLPAAGDLEFEVVPKGLVEEAYKEGYGEGKGDEYKRLLAKPDQRWNESDARRKLEEFNGN